jgi:hypothetical protein
MTHSDDSYGPVDGSEPTVADVPTGVTDLEPPLHQQRTKALVIFAATFVGLAVIVAAALFASGRGGTANSGGAPLSGSTSGPAAASSHPTGTSTLAPSTTPEDVAAAIHLPTKLRHVLRLWNNGTGGTALAAVSNDLGVALQAGGVKQYVSMRAACASLTTAVSAARTGPPIPNQQVQDRYTVALTQVATAAAKCHAAISERVDGDETVATYENQSLFHQAESDFGVAIKDLYDVTAELAAAGR